MNGVIGMTDLALDTPLNATQHEYLTIVKNSAKSLMVILNDILDFSKIEAGKLDIEWVEFSLASTVTETLKTIEARAVKKGLTLTCQLGADFPQQVRGDPGRIRQILTNLCDNAIKFTAQGGVTVGVAYTRLSVQEGEIHVSVRDTGIGIPTEKQQGVFEAFSQADASTTRQFGGTGLGLAISARLVALMGGRIWVESEPGQGSTFHFTVRVQQVAPLARTTPAPQLAAPVEAPAQVAARSLQVLLVEDYPVNQILVTTLLKKWGHAVVLANNGQEAVNLFPGQPWDVVIMDMQMPVMGGLEATRIIRASEPSGQHTPIIAMTANAMESDRLACIEAGMDDYLTKPFNAAVLKAMIERAVTVLTPNA
jgi:CheY-like chemotaxis protein